ncbi:MAG: hypothetical protein HY040_03855 [Planctomycetes bacterium]|nr:hypothetical protein [Planctomycetota bacterium]
MRQTMSVLFRSAIIASIFSTGVTWAQEKQVTLQKTPHGGIQPQAVIDGKGVVHLLYFKGEPKAGDLFCCRREPGKSAFSEPLKVNSHPGSAVAIGTIRGGQIALGKNTRVHVAWNGSGASKSKPGKGSPMLYARLNAAGTTFEDERNLMTQTAVLDGGGTVAADQSGNVYVAWHALAAGTERGEDKRKVWVAHSTDEGKTFAAERPAFDKPTGACGCCGMKGFVDSKGNAYFIYRTAADGIHRDMFLLSSADKTNIFQGELLHRWEIGSCPMSSQSFAEGPDNLYTAWDTDGQVYFARIKPGSPQTEKPIAAPGDGKGRKHPALAVNKKGEIILVWTEGTSWQRGGGLAWQVYDKEGLPTKERGRLANGIAVWSLPTVVAEADGKFTILH